MAVLYVQEINFFIAVNFGTWVISNSLCFDIHLLTIFESSVSNVAIFDKIKVGIFIFLIICSCLIFLSYSYVFIYLFLETPEVKILRQQSWLLRTLAVELRITSAHHQRSHVQRLLSCLLDDKPAIENGLYLYYLFCHAL